MKIIHVITKLELGGAQQNTLWTCKNLDINKFDTTLVCGKGGILDKDAQTNVSKIIFSKYLVREISPFKDMMAFFELFFIFKKEKPDIIHTHSSKAGIIARIAAFLAGVKKIIHSYHGFGFNNSQPALIRYFYILLEKISAIYTDAFIFVSNDNIKTAMKYKIGNPERYNLIRSGINLSKFSKEKDFSFLENLGITKNNSKIISTVANLKPQKNPHDFIKIAEQIIKKGIDAYFIYAGGGKNINYFRKLVNEMGIATRCIFVDWVSEPFKVYRASDIFLLTSLWEGLPRSLIEAICSGVVPVCYKTDGVNDIIIDGVNGFMVEQKDIAKASSIIEKLITDNEFYEKIKNNVLKTNLNEFDIDNMVKKQEILYTTLMEEHA
ncbi:MAG: glycosyltransferase family 4 protein [Elusimicrobiota bacterium]